MPARLRIGMAVDDESDNDDGFISSSKRKGGVGGESIGRHKDVASAYHLAKVGLV